MISYKNRMLQLRIAQWLAEFQKHLPVLLAIYGNEALRSHPVWGKALPFEVLPYGKGKSIAHAIRLDVVLTEAGPICTEVDFVGAGAGVMLHALPDTAKRAGELSPRVRFANAYRNFFRTILSGPYGIQRVLCGMPAIVDSKWGNDLADAQLLVSTLAAMGVPIELLKLGSQIPANTPDASVLYRLFYRYEVAEQDWNRAEVITKEPLYDSKVFAALIHDPDSENFLMNALGMKTEEFFKSMLFLRSFLPKSCLLSTLQGKPVTLEGLAHSRQKYLLKNGDVEHPGSWGARGVGMGLRFNYGQFREALFTGHLKGKDLGSSPIVQQYVPSVDFNTIWNLAALGELMTARTDLGAAFVGEPEQPMFATNEPVHARISVFVFVNNPIHGNPKGAHRVTIVPHGLVTLRAGDPVVHGTGDAGWLPFEII